MPGTDTHPTEWHILQVFQHFGLTQAHVAAHGSGVSHAHLPTGHGPWGARVGVLPTGCAGR